MAETPPVSEKPAGSAPSPLAGLAMQWRGLQSLAGGSRVCLAVDLGMSQIKALWLSRRRGTTAWEDAWTAPVPPDVRSRPDKRQAFYLQTLREYLSQTRPPMLSEIVLCLSGPEVHLSTVFVPSDSGGQVRQAVEAELRQVLPYPLEKADWTYSLPAELVQTGDGKVPVSAAAIESEWLEKIEELCRSFRLIPSVVAPAPLGFFRFLFLEEGRGDAPALAAMDMGFTACTLLFVHNGQLEFIRLIPMGTDHLARALMRTVLTTEGQHAITPSEAEEILRTYGAGTENPSQRIAGLDATQSYSLLRPNIEYLFLEIQRSLRYYSQTFQRPAPDRLWVGGGGACIPGLVEYLNANMDAATVSTLDPAQMPAWEKLSAEAKEELRGAGPLFASVSGGASLAEDRAGGGPVLLRRSVRREWAFLAGWWIGWAALAAGLALTFFLNVQAGKYRRIAAESRVRLAQMESSMTRVQEYDRLKAEVEGKEALLKRAAGSQALWTGVLKELSRITPEGIRLSQVETVTGPGSTRLRLAGEILPTYTTPEMLYTQYQLMLDQSPFFTDIRLGSMRKDMRGTGSSQVFFELTCQVVY